jgi:hypothetical protein
LNQKRSYLKVMNCPHHHRIFAAQPRSYRDLPLRLAEYGTCYRYEQSGELFGLMRVRYINSRTRGSLSASSSPFHERPFPNRSGRPSARAGNPVWQ